MTSATHYAFSYLLCSAAGLPHSVALPASLAALLPDIDHPQSLVGRVFPFASKYLLRKYGHRTITHSLIAVMTVALVLSPTLFFSGAVYGALVLSFSSHIFIDLFNMSGVKLLSPFSQKEYISFRTPELRVMVSSWKEYALLFIIVFLAFTVSGEAFSLTRAVRSISKLFYRHYDGAVTDYQNNSEYLCTAKVEYFNHTTTRMVTEYFIVLNMYAEKMYGLKIKAPGEEKEIVPSREGRTILKKADINEIEITHTKKKIYTKTLSGSDLSDLSRIPAGAFVSGTIVIKNYHPEFKNTDYIRLDHTPSSTTITVTCAIPQELVDIIRIDTERDREIRSLKSKTSEYQIGRLNAESASLKRRLVLLEKKGFYENYLIINRLNSELKKVESRIDTLRMREASGTDVDNLMKIEKMEKDFSVEYKIYVIHFD